MENQKEIIGKGKNQSIKGSKDQSKEELKIDKGNIQESIKEESKGSDNQFKSDLYISYNGNPNKSQRGKLRNQLSSHIKGIFKSHEEKDIDKRNEKIESFKEFYKNNYLKNDYSIRSLYHGSSSSSQYELINEFLNQLKRLKSIDLEISK